METGRSRRREPIRRSHATSASTRPGHVAPTEPARTSPANSPRASPSP